MPRSERVLPRCAPLADGDRKLSSYEVHLPYPARRRNSRQHGESRHSGPGRPSGRTSHPTPSHTLTDKHGKRTSRNIWRKQHAGSNCGAVTNAPGDNGTRGREASPWHFFTSVSHATLSGPGLWPLRGPVRSSDSG